MRIWTLPGVTLGLVACDASAVLFIERKNEPVVLLEPVRLVTFSRNE
jgi:hypothetical protein